MPSPRPTDQPAEPSSEHARVSRIYRRYATSRRKQRSWSSDNPGNAAIRQELATVMREVATGDLRGDGEALDVGCGSGWWLEYLAALPEVGALHGIEILPQRAAAAQARVPEATVTVADARNLPYADGRFRVVFMFTVLSSLANPADMRAALREAARVVAPGGLLAVWEPRLPNPFNRSTISIRETVLRAALPDAQLASRTITLLPPLARGLGRAADRVYPWLARIPPLRSHRLWEVRMPAN